MKLREAEEIQSLVTQKTDAGKMNSICSRTTQVVPDNQMEETKNNNESH